MPSKYSKTLTESTQKHLENEEEAQNKHSSKPSILIVEDEVEISELIKIQLTEAGMIPSVCYSMEQTMEFLENKPVDLILLDIILPDQDGRTLVRSLRNRGIETPIIFLSGIQSKEQRVKALNLGGDDFITKPFDFPELIARINAVLRRAETTLLNRLKGDAGFRSEPFLFCGCTVKPENRTITFTDGQTEELGAKEIGLLTCLYESQGIILSRRLLIRKVWGLNANFGGRSIDQYIARLRRLLTNHGCDQTALVTIRGTGYRYQPNKMADDE